MPQLPHDLQHYPRGRLGRTAPPSHAHLSDRPEKNETTNLWRAALRHLRPILAHYHPSNHLLQRPLRHHHPSNRTHQSYLAPLRPTPQPRPTPVEWPCPDVKRSIVDHLGQLRREFTPNLSHPPTQSSTLTPPRRSSPLKQCLQARTLIAAWSSR